MSPSGAGGMFGRVCKPHYPAASDVSLRCSEEKSNRLSSHAQCAERCLMCEKNLSHAFNKLFEVLILNIHYCSASQVSICCAIASCSKLMINYYIWTLSSMLTWRLNACIFTELRIVAAQLQ